MNARTANLLLGSWVVVSAFAWPHRSAELASTVTAGALCFAIAFAAVVHPPARRWNVLVGAWLLVSFVVLPHRPATAIHNALAGVAIIAFALRPTPGWQRPVTLEQALREIADAVARAPSGASARSRAR